MHAVTCTLQNLINQAVPDTVLLTMLTGLTKSKDKEYMFFVKVMSIFLRKLKITSSYRGVRVIEGKITVRGRKEIQGKSVLVRVIWS